MGASEPEWKRFHKRFGQRYMIDQYCERKRITEAEMLRLPVGKVFADLTMYAEESKVKQAIHHRQTQQMRQGR